MVNAYRFASAGACSLVLLLGCERGEEVLAPQTAAFLVGAAALSSIVTDPEGDMSTAIAPAARQPYRDIVRAEISKQGRDFIFTMQMAGDVPETPALAPPGFALLEWSWRLDVNRATFPAGFPYSPGTPSPGEYRLQIHWDGTRFTGQFVDRTPLLAGHEATIVPLVFGIDGAELRTSVDVTIVGDPSTFRWSVETAAWPSRFETNSLQVVDIAPSLNFGEPPAVWPS